mgnify:FL=1
MSTVSPVERRGLGAQYERSLQAARHGGDVRLVQVCEIDEHTERTDK